MPSMPSIAERLLRPQKSSSQMRFMPGTIYKLSEKSPVPFSDSFLSKREETAAFLLAGFLAVLAAQGLGQAGDAQLDLGPRGVLDQRHAGIARAHHGLGVIRQLPVDGFAD